MAEFPTYGYGITVPIANYRSRRYDTTGQLSPECARLEIAWMVLQDMVMTKDPATREALRKTIEVDLGVTIPELYAAKGQAPPGP